MNALRHYARAGGNADAIAQVASLLATQWDPTGELVAPDNTRDARSHAVTVLGILATGPDIARVSRYLREAEERAWTVPRTNGHDRCQLAEAALAVLRDAAEKAAAAERTATPPSAPASSSGRPRQGRVVADERAASGVLLTIIGVFVTMVLVGRGGNPEIVESADALAVKGWGYSANIPYATMDSIGLRHGLDGIGDRRNGLQSGNSYAGRFAMKPYGRSDAVRGCAA